MSRHVLVTGASTGIGRACAIHLAAKGWTVHAGVRGQADGDELTKAGAITSVVLDITNAESIASAAAELSKRVGAEGLTGLINNAGICVAGPVETVPVEDWRRQFEVNVFGHIALTQALLPLLRRSVESSGGARIVMMSSIAGRVGQPVLGPYCASKFALEAVADALRCELAGEKICVSLIEPGAVKSEIWRKGQEAGAGANVPERYRAITEGLSRAAKEAERRAIPADRVAHQVERCLTRSRPPIRVLVGMDAKMGASMVRLMPRRWFDKLLVAVMTAKPRKAQ